MPSNQTTNYQLSQWAKSDQVKMEDFNADNAKLDAALAAQAEALAAEAGTRAAAVQSINTALAEKVEIIAGTYKGDGATRRFIDLGRTPKAVLLFEANGRTHVEMATCIGGLALPGHPAGAIGADNTAAEIVDNGFNVGVGSNGSSQVWSNLSNHSYHYLAFV